MSHTILHGDCIEQMRTLPDNSVDAIVTDPPYDLTTIGRSFQGKGGTMRPDGGMRSESRTGGFMGKAWDGTGIAFNVETWAEALRVLKPGGHLLAFGGTRTHHRMMVAIEDAGWEIRDCLMWMFGSGFPKSHNLDGEWDGWGSALKPGYEPIVLARKPLSKPNIAANVLRWGTGALNIDGCRVSITDALPNYTTPGKGVIGGNGIYSGSDDWYHGAQQQHPDSIRHDARGRWPANVILSHHPDCEPCGTKRIKGSDPRRADGTVNGSWGTNGVYGGAASSGMEKPRYVDADGYETVEAWRCVEGCPVAMLDAQSGHLHGSGNKADTGNGTDATYDASSYHVSYAGRANRDYGAQGGGASRFFYQAKASKRERRGSAHPTIKPLSLMRYLVRLITPPGGVVLDPFAGSGTTGEACVLEGFGCILIEREAEYVADIQARFRAVQPPLEMAAG